MSNANSRVECVRIDASQVRVNVPSGLDIRLFANEQVPIDRASLAEVGALSGIAETVRELDAKGYFGSGASVKRCVLTPDFHRGSGIPVGTVIEAEGLVFPRAAGGDIGCGMRLLATDLSLSEFLELGSELDRLLRHACFEGGRDLPLSERARAALLLGGIPGLLEALECGGLWSGLGIAGLEDEIAHSHRGGSWATNDLWMFADYVRGSGGVSRDAAVGSIGGGNHFVEIQHVAERPDPARSYRWGLRQGVVTIMVHTGSVGLGSLVGDHFMHLARDLHPAGSPLPSHGFHPLPLTGPLGRHGQAYLSAMGLAANFAAVNRLALGQMVLGCLSKALGRQVQGRLVYDAPHNLAWADSAGRVVHRKGACPAEYDPEDSVYPDGIPVIVPGSMGAESWVLRGLGGQPNLCSAPHGAGRLTSRGEGRRASPGELSALRVVTKVDLTKIRPDIAAELGRDLLEEAPSMYKPVMPAIESCVAAGIAEPVAVLRPLLTIKG